MHFKTQTESVKADCNAPSNLDLPLMQDITHNSTDPNIEEKESDKQAPVIYSPSKILFVYEALSDVGETVRIMGDTGATVALVNKDELDNIGPYEVVGSTKISGVSNLEVTDISTTVKISLEARFDNKWQSHQFQAAILPVITELNAADHTRAIVAALEALESKCPHFMASHGNYINIKHFQTRREKGDVSLLLGVSEITFHPKILVQFAN